MSGIGQGLSGSDLCGASFSALAILGNAGAERDRLPALQVLDREAVLLARIPRDAFVVNRG
jgi:hypothetical protein